MRSPRRASHLTALACVALAPTLLGERAAAADVNLGLQAGVAHRNASAPALDAGLAFGGYAELSLLPFIRLGAYALHSRLPIDVPAGESADGPVAITDLGLRLRALIPIPGTPLYPFAHAGIGPAIVSYPATSFGGIEKPGAYGGFFDTPLGLGLALEVGSLVHLSAEFDVRPGFGYFGAANQSSVFGWSALGGVALEL